MRDPGRRARSGWHRTATRAAVGVVVVAMCLATGGAARDALTSASEGLGPASPHPLPADLVAALRLTLYEPGMQPPPFAGRTVAGETVRLADFRDRVVLLNFWASWCLECRPEMPVLERLHARFGRAGLAIIGINAREAPGAIRRYADELGLTFPLVLDPSGAIGAAYGVVGLPTTFLIDRDGRAVARAIGPRAWGGAPAVAVLRALLEAPRPSRPAP